MKLLFVANFLKNLPKKAQVVILVKAVIEQTTITVKELLKYSSSNTNFETNVMPAITPLGFKNWNIKVSINLTGLTFSSSLDIDENDILYAK